MAKANNSIDLIGRNELLELVNWTGSPCLSIFMATERIGPDVQQNPIRLRNLLETAEEKIRARGLGSAEVREFLAPAENLLTDAGFWQRQSEGLGLFIAPGRFDSYRLPIAFEETVYLNNRFYVKPLLPILEGNGCFYVLALSQNHIRLLEGDRFEFHEVDLGDTPTDMETALGLDEDLGQFQNHTTTSLGPRGGRSAVFFGHGTTADDSKKENIARFFQMVDRGVYARIGNSTQPLVLTGVEYLLPIYRAASRYPHIIEQTLTGNPENMSSEELHDEAWRLVAPLYQAARQEAVEGYHILANDGQATRDIRQILPAAHFGQVDILLLARGRSIWGSYQPDNQSVTMHNTRREVDEDLTEIAAAQALANKGMVYVLDPGEMPDGAAVAATLRWPLKGMSYPG